jgi:hypothetical protein
MNKTFLAKALLTLASLALGGPGFAAMNPKLEPLKPLVGKTWRATMPDSTPEKPVVDVSRFELALNGQAVRNFHSINDGVYGGESLYYWDQEKQSVVTHYFTTAGFYTVGTMRVEGGTLVFHDVVKGAAEGITEVKATSRLLPDGRLHVNAQYLKDGKWGPGRDTYYVEDPSAVVRFKE